METTSTGMSGLWGKVEQRLIGYDTNHNPKYKPHCVKCGNSNIPQLILGGGAAGKRLHLPAYMVTYSKQAL